MKTRLLIYTLIIIIILPLFSCRNKRRQPQEGRSSHSKVTPTQPETKTDTVYLIVPTPNILPEPTTTSDGENLIIIPSSKKLEPVVHNNNLPHPPVIDFIRPTNCHTRDEYIEHFNITGNMKDLIIACDYDTPTVRNNTANLVHASPGNFNLGQICDIFDFCYINWSYVNDPISREYFAKASETLRNGLNGDCDDFAILLCSMILSIGGEARINFAYDATSGHAFSEVNIGKTNKTQVQHYLSARYNDVQMWHRKDSEGNIWLNLDWQAAYPGGEYWKFTHGTSFNIIRNIYEYL